MQEFCSEVNECDSKEWRNWGLWSEGILYSRRVEEFVLLGHCSIAQLESTALL